MDKKCKICWLLLILFLVLNILFIGVWINRTNERNTTLIKDSKIDKSGTKTQKKYRNYLVTELKMDSVQAKEYSDLKGKHSADMKETMRKIDSLRVLLGNEVFSEAQDSARLSELIENITTQKVIFEWNNINHLKDVKSILNEEQKISFDKLHKRMMNRMSHGGESPHRGQGRSRQVSSKQVDSKQ